MPNSTRTPPAVTRLPRKPRSEITYAYVVTVQHVTEDGFIAAQHDTGQVSLPASSSAGDVLALIFARLLHGLPQADQVAAR